MKTLFVLIEKAVWKIRKKYVNIIRFLQVKYRWKREVKNPEFTGISGKKRNPRVIISLTSYPERICIVSETIKSLMVQEMKADKIVLWLTYEEFSDGEKALPQSILDMKKFGLEIEWTHNMRSYNKLIPSLKKFPDDILITADDDIYYPKDWLSKLYESYQLNPREIHCHRVSLFYKKNGEYRRYICEKRKDIIVPAAYSYELTGVGGVLYPPHIMHSDVLKEEIFMQDASTNDDLWFWFMAIKNNVKIRVVKDGTPLLAYVHATQSGKCLYKINNLQGKLWEDFRKLLIRYPEVDELLQIDNKEFDL